jgi:GcrA cell cycle regulator
MPDFSTRWTPELCDQLIALAEQNLSGSQIAVKLGGGLSRSAVIAKLSRLNLHPKFPSLYEWTPERNEQLRALVAQKISVRLITKEMGASEKTIRRQGHLLALTFNARGSRHAGRKSIFKEPYQPAIVPLRTLEGEIDVSEGNKPLANSAVVRLERQACKWPVGDPMTAEFAFCGEQAEYGRPYCVEHRRQAKAPTYVPRSTRPFYRGGSAR